MKTSIYLLAGCLFMNTLCIAGNEPIAKGTGTIQLDFKTTKFNDVFDNDGQLRNADRGFYVPKIQFSSFNVESKYGITDKLTANFVVPAFCSGKVTDNVSSRSFSGLGDISMGLNYALTTQNKVQPVISVFQNLPTGNNDTNGLNTGFGDFANSIFIDVFYKYNSNFTFSWSAGYQNRKKEFRNDFLGSIQSDYIQKDKFKVSLFMRGKIPFTELRNQDNFVNYGLFKNSEGFLRYGASLDVYLLKNISLVVNYENYLLGQFIGNGPIYGAGIKVDLGRKSSSEESTKESKKESSKE